MPIITSIAVRDVIITIVDDEKKSGSEYTIIQHSTHNIDMENKSKSGPPRPGLKISGAGLVVVGLSCVCGI